MLTCRSSTHGRCVDREEWKRRNDAGQGQHLWTESAQGTDKMQERDMQLTLHQADLPDGRARRALFRIQMDLLEGNDLRRRPRPTLRSLSTPIRLEGV